MRFQDARSTVFTIIAMLVLSTVATQAKTRFKVLHFFHGADGAAPYGVLVRDAAGNLYGTTGAGGNGTCSQEGCGTAFKLDKSGKQVWLHNFNGRNGFSPSAGLLRAAGGNLFGTTVEGGDTNCDRPYGCGTVFRLNAKTGQEAMLYKFKGTPDGMNPESLLVEGDSGSVYGTTPLGGMNGLGAVFRIDKTGKETILYSFTGGADGCDPVPGVILDSKADLYGVTFDGGSGFCNSGVGVVFKVDSAGHETVLHTFGGSDGANPDSVLLLDSNGDLYGTTANGGNSLGCGNTGCGTVFQLPSGGAETVLYSFCSLTNCTDGEGPLGPLIMDVNGKLLGATYFGGKYGDGTIFRLDSSGNEAVLHSFSGGRDGGFPSAGLAMGGSGILYGATTVGGAKCYGSYTCGVVFRLKP